MEDTTMMKRKFVFCSQRNKQVNGMKKREVFCGRRKKMMNEEEDQK